jgi:hypothetical protein
MPWDRSQPTDPKYRSKEHRAERARLNAQLHRDGFLMCAQPECVEDDRTIYPGTRWCAGHDESGTRYIGPVHFVCNIRDGAKRGNARARGEGGPVRRWPL